MAKQRRTLGIPVHPLLVHFPIAFWLATPFLDIASLLAGEPWTGLALGAAWAGTFTGAAAVVTGLLEYAQPSLAGIDMRLAARHGTRTALAWCIFTSRGVAGTFFTSTGWEVLYLGLDIAGCLILIQGVYFGTRQVYEQLEKN